MSMHKIPLTADEREGLQSHGLDIGTPSQLSDVFRQGMAWANSKAAAECERLRGEVSDLHTTMMAAAVEIKENWDAHCDAEGYGPANLMHRLERGIAAQYGYSAETVVRMEAQRDAALAELAALKGGQEARRDWPDDDIVAAWKWCEENGGTPAEFLSYSLLGKRSRVLGRPLTWREAIELTHATTDMPDEQRDKLLAMDDAPPAQASAWVPVSERLPELEQNVLVEFTTIHGTPQHTTATLHRISQHCGPDTPYHNRWFVTVGNGHELHTVTRWQPIAAPTPGASDGKGGE